MESEYKSMNDLLSKNILLIRSQESLYVKKIREKRYSHDSAFYGGIRRV